MPTVKSALALAVATEIGRADLEALAETWYDDALHLVIIGKDGQGNTGDHRWSFLQQVATRPTVIGTQKYGLPGDFRDFITLMYQVSATDESKVTFRPSPIFRKLYEGATPGRPRRWTVIGSDLYLGPPPDAVATLQMDYDKWHPVVASGGTSLLPDPIEGIQRLYMLWRGYDALRETEKAKEKLGAAELLLSRAVAADESRDNDVVYLEPFRATRSATPPPDYWLNPFYP